MNDLLCELSLTCTHELASFLLLPLLPHLIKPLAYALKGKDDDLISIGLGVFDCLMNPSSIHPALEFPSIREVTSQVLISLALSHLFHIVVRPVVVFGCKGIVKPEVVDIGLGTVENMIQSTLSPDFLEPNIANLISQAYFAVFPNPIEWGSKALGCNGFMMGITATILHSVIGFLKLEELFMVAGYDEAYIPLDYCLALTPSLLRLALEVFNYERTALLVARKVDEILWVGEFMKASLRSLESILERRQCLTKHLIFSLHSLARLLWLFSHWFRATFGWLDLRLMQLFKPSNSERTVLFVERKVDEILWVGEFMKACLSSVGFILERTQCLAKHLILSLHSLARLLWLFSHWFRATFGWLDLRFMQINKVREMNLSGNQEMKKMEKKRMSWKVKDDSNDVRGLRGAPLDHSDLIVQLGPMEIRTTFGWLDLRLMQLKNLLT